MSFKQVSDSLAWRIDFAKQLRSAIAYPALVGSLLVLVMVFLVTTVVPSLSGFLGTVGQELSWHTRQLLVMSNFLYNWGFRFMLTIVLTAAILYFICRFSERSALLRDRLFLQLPLFGELIRKISLARFTQGLSDLLCSRLNLYDALLSSSRLVSNRYLSDSIGLLPVTVQEGLKLSDAMRASGVFDSAAIQAVSVGEHSGDLPNSILEVSALYANDVSAYLQQLQRLIGPVMMSIVGFFIIWIVLSVVAPIYQAAIGAGALL